MLEARSVFAGPLVRIADVTCRAPRSGCGAEEYADSPEVVVPRRGVFTVRV